MKNIAIVLMLLFLSACNSGMNTSVAGDYKVNGVGATAFTLTKDGKFIRFEYTEGGRLIEKSINELNTYKVEGSKIIITYVPKNDKFARFMDIAADGSLSFPHRPVRLIKVN